MAKLHFFGGTKTVSGSNYLLEACGKKLIVDCGSFQGTKGNEAKNQGPLPYDAKSVDFAIMTHAHLDHIGRLPLLIKSGFRGKIFATSPTIEFTRLMLEDSCKLLTEKAKRADAVPLFCQDDIDIIMGLFEAVDYHQGVELSEDLSFVLFESGHILGSSFIDLKFEEDGKKRTVVFSGDLGNKNAPILRDLERAERADYVLIESAYGDREHEENDAAKNIIEDAVEETVAKKGVLLIPSFAMERTQQLLFHFNELVEHKRIPQVPIFIDSPLAIGVTRFYEKYNDYFDEEADKLIRLGDDIFNFPGLKFTASVKESKSINDVAPPKIVIAGSGMSQGGRIVHHEARYLPDERNTLLLVTYQAEGTLGRQIQDGAKEVEILDEKVTVRAKIKSITSYSAHADQAGLMNWLSNIQKPVKKVFVVQGEEKPAAVLAQKIKDILGISAQVPEFGETVELE